MDALRSWLWPGHCLLCRARIASGAEICAGCRTDLPWIRAACPQCATPLPADAGTAPCGACQQKPPVFNRACAALHYAAPIDRLIVDLKYHRRLDLARALARLLAEQLSSAVDLPDLIVPMPLHGSRLRERGYNQSLELARVLARHLQLPLKKQLVKRVRATPTQTSLPLEQRGRNVRNAFAAHTDVNGLRIAVVDDVMTSGHTANAIAKALRRAGAEDISIWVVARA
jgi:ComF family protein